jgi:hypothetical protein
MKVFDKSRQSSPSLDPYVIGVICMKLRRPLLFGRCGFIATRLDPAPPTDEMQRQWRWVGGLTVIIT